MEKSILNLWAYLFEDGPPILVPGDLGGGVSAGRAVQHHLALGAGLQQFGRGLGDLQETAAGPHAAAFLLLKENKGRKRNFKS